jgi:hypothetical protein
MNNQILDKLKSLQKVRGDITAFSNHDEFLPWSDSVTPLLEFDEAISKQFMFWSDHVKSAYRMGHEHHEALGEAIGIVNQAVTKLELQPPVKGTTIAKIDAMPIDDLAYQINLGRKSPYQREKMAYIKSRYQLLISEKKKQESTELVAEITPGEPVSWDNKPIGKVGLSVSGIFIAGCLAFLVSKYLGIEL